MNGKPIKPLGIRAYGSIPHLPGSRRGPADKGLSEEQARILTTKARDKHDVIYVQEKLDGSCVSVAKINGDIIALIRAGYPASGSNYTQHHAFAEWVKVRHSRFNALLNEGERVCGEWLLQAHGTPYKLKHEPFVAFDIMRDHRRAPTEEVMKRCGMVDITTPWLLHAGAPMSVCDALFVLELDGHGAHGAVELAEGCVWRCERNGEVDFLGKFVRPEKVDGKYLESQTNKEAVYNLQTK